MAVAPERTSQLPRSPTRSFKSAIFPLFQTHAWKIASVEPVGHYAIRIVFDDRHDSGIYSWAYLRELSETRAERWATYEAALAQRGLSRDT